MSERPSSPAAGAQPAAHRAQAQGRNSAQAEHGAQAQTRQGTQPDAAREADATGAPGEAHGASDAAAGGATLTHSSTLFLLLRRIRAPLMTLIAVYAIAVAGFALIPGVDAAGAPAPPMRFFHAFYFVTYTATTIGFGELPGPFSDAQRIWTTVVIYLSVTGWTYTLLTLLTMFQDRNFLRALAALRFERRVSRIAEPFCLVLGCGDTGYRLARVFDRMAMRFIIVEKNAARLEELELEDFRSDLLALNADAGEPQTLIRAGLRHPMCRWVLALTNDDLANLAVVTSARLLNPAVPVIARTYSVDTATLMRSFGRPQIINPFEAFAEHLMLAMRAPGCYRLFDWLTAPQGSELGKEHEPPRGAWIVCGYGRFGRAVGDRLAAEGNKVRIVDPSPLMVANAEVITGDGSESAVLEMAEVRSAVGLVAATEHDLRNLAIASLAQSINPKLFTVLRQNDAANGVLFRSFRADLVMRPSEIVADECVARLTSPLLLRFLNAVRRERDSWADEVIHQLRKRGGTRAPATWSVKLDDAQAPAVIERLADTDRPLTIGDLLRDPDERQEKLPALALLVLRDGRETLLPGEDFALAGGDEILFAGRSRASRRMTATLC
ncbi:MAG: NAD-binding protein, partial [Burkholderiaceae bacterium]|nr:NAD-binding protein [Burkholderiaceae bacterium]